MKVPRPQSTLGAFVELIAIVAFAIGLALLIQAFIVKPFLIPSASMVPTLTEGQRVLVDRVSFRLGGDPEIGDIIVFHPPTGAEGNRCGAEHEPKQACPEPTAGELDTNFIKRIVAGPATSSTSRTVTPVVNGVVAEEPFIKECGGGPECNLTEADHDPGRSLLHDGRQPWRQRRQPLLGTRPRRLDHRTGLRHLLASEPLGHLLAPSRLPRPSRSGAGAGRDGRRTTWLFRFDQSFGTRFVAGADEAGRGSLAGPLVAAGGPLRLRPDRARAAQGARRARRLQAQDRGGEGPPLPGDPRHRRARSSSPSRCAGGIDSRGLHVTNLEALGECLAKVAVDGATCLSDGFRLGRRCPVEHRHVVEGDARSAAIAAASVVAKVTRDRYMRRADELFPGWDFAGNVGYSSESHRDAIERLGISPLHRRSFASVAYSQLELG